MLRVLRVLRALLGGVVVGSLLLVQPLSAATLTLTITVPDSELAEVLEYLTEEGLSTPEKLQTHVDQLLHRQFQDTLRKARAKRQAERVRRFQLLSEAEQEQRLQ